MHTYEHFCLSYEQLHNDSGTNKYKKYTWCWYKRSISMESKLLYEWLRTYSKNGWCAWPKQETLAMQLGKHPKTIRRWIAELVQAGLIEKIKTRISGAWSLTYVFLPHPDMPAGERNRLMTALDALYRSKNQETRKADFQAVLAGAVSKGYLEN
ncbi:helix-turn-helix domain-containing protein [Desulfobulbus sp.]|uniref:helix-turn-helix domain-containing protein n=1 Tax=Desulfobulbus sp. TaxID=895 RepID=UPI00286F63AA|nr:helix-turn-helix domain-containing protein [Desulfobulbus sp.]